MAHYDVRADSGDSSEKQAQVIMTKITQIINTQYSELLLAEIDSTSSTALGGTICCNIKINKGNRQGETIYSIYLNSNTYISATSMLTDNNNDYYNLPIDINYNTYTMIGLNYLVSLDILPLKNGGIMLGVYASTSTTEDIKAHGYTIHEIITFDDEDNCITLSYEGDSNNHYYVLNDGTNKDKIFTVYNPWRYKTASDVIQFNKLYGLNHFIDMINIVTVGPNPALQNYVEKITIDNKPYYYLSRFYGMSSSYLPSATSWVFETIA